MSQADPQNSSPQPPSPMPPLLHPVNPARGIVRNARVELELNNDVIADSLRAGLENILKNAPGVTLSQLDEPHESLLEINHFKLAEQWLNAAEQRFIKIRAEDEDMSRVLLNIK